MPSIYCKACGQPTEYSGLAGKPSFCGSCGKPLGVQSFFSTPVTSIPVPTAPIHPVVQRRSQARHGQEPDEDGEPEFEGQDPFALAASFRQGITVNPGKTKITVEEAIKDASFGTRSGGRQMVSSEGIEVKNNDQPYACLDPKQFPQRPAPAPAKAHRGRRKKSV